jgi:regulatory protein
MAGGQNDSIRAQALRLLARREHSARELAAKLAARGHPEPGIASVLADLAREGLQSDARFAEGYVFYRAGRGYGPLRIREELRQRGIAGDLIDTCLKEAETDWTARLAEVRRKRFGPRIPADLREQSRQARFLQARGFAIGDIRRLLRQGDD